VYIVIGASLVAVIGMLVKYQYKGKKDSVNVTEFPDLTEIIDPNCQEPTPENPFANTLLSDLPNTKGFNDKAPACSSHKAKKEIKDAFFHSFEQNPWDLYDRTHHQRQFHSMPNTTVPNDQGGFAEWLYKKDKVCKQENEVCTGWESGGPGGGGGSKSSSS
tara:strand:- start:2558 stop:3040 length:483 start_codon:yes stop_codon:yes gene_type:complete